MTFSDRNTNIIVLILIIIMGITAVFSAKNDSTNMDELAHIPAGYSYLSQKDFRLNPEHPPLIKDLSALPLLSQNLNFPKNHSSWQNEINSQWDFGTQFLYFSGNDADKIVFLARLPMIMFLIFMALFLFSWAKQLVGNKWALFILCLFSFSPTFLAHGRLVTTDVGAAFGVIFASYYWLNFLKDPSKKNIFFAGISFGIAMLLKFSLILLIPFFGIITIIYAFLKTESIKQTLKYIGFAFLIGIIGTIFVILPVYQFHVLNYPIEKQVLDTQSILESNTMPVLKDVCLWLSNKPIIRSLGEYLLGILMVTQRTMGGNTTYFLGMVSTESWLYYFPVAYLLKVPLSFHILWLIALIGTLYTTKKSFYVKSYQQFRKFFLDHFTEFSMVVFLAIYWIVSMEGNLNIGIRHILPVFSFTYILLAVILKNFLSKIKQKKNYKLISVLIISLLVWYIGSSVSTFPYYLSYYNEIGGGTKNGYKYIVDSNYDWGQDLKRLKQFTQENNIEKIYIDYFGGCTPEYYFGDKFIQWHGDFDESEFEKPNYLAVSATFLQQGRANGVKGYNQPTNFYLWLNKYKPQRIGTSIFLYYIE